MKAARRSAFKARLRWPCLNTGSPGGHPCLRSSWPGDPGPGPGDTGPGFKGPETGGGPGAARGEVGARGGRVVLSRRPDTETARSGFTAVCRGIRPCCQSLGTRHSNTAWEKMGCWGDVSRGSPVTPTHNLWRLVLTSLYAQSKAVLAYSYMYASQLPRKYTLFR